MIARRKLPVDLATWNTKWRAPFGPSSARVRAMVRRSGIQHRLARFLGPFAYQSNSSTRIYEYPWTYKMIQPRPGMKVLELGGALSGLQFVLAKEGCEVHNVDPFEDYGSG